MCQTRRIFTRQKCSTGLLLVKKRPSLIRQCAVTTRLQAFSVPDKATSTIGSINNLLGSRDDDDETAAVQQDKATPIQLLRVPGWSWSELREPRVAPFAANVLYYLLLIVYTSYYVVQLAEGQEVADDLLARLANDHAAVASGDTLRLFTSFFVADSIPQLIISLVGLATIAAELESLLGYSTFWAVWCVAVLAGGLADAALSSLPITAGPAAGVGGAAAALLAHHLQNWRLEQLLAQAQAGEVPESLLQLEHQYNRQQRLAAAGGQEGESSSSSSSAGAVQHEQQQQEQWGGTLTHEDSSAYVETELEGPIGLSVSLLLPREGKAFVTLGGTAVAVVAALKDAADSDVATDWAALVAAFVVGGVLGWLACPVYSIKLVPANLRSVKTAEQRSMTASDDEQLEASEDSADLLLPVLYDVRPGTDRANAVVGAAALLFAAVGVWLSCQGLFL